MYMVILLVLQNEKSEKNSHFYRKNARSSDARHNFHCKYFPIDREDASCVRGVEKR